MARPKTDKYNIKKMAKIIEEYSDKTELPILKEVCYINKWNYDYVMQLQREYDELSQSIKHLLNKKEVALEKGAIIGKYNNTMAIFSLKQLGWKDRQDLEDVETINTPTINLIISDNTKLEKVLYE